MAFNKVTTYGESLGILESEVGLVTKTRKGTQAMGKDDDGRKIIKAGTLVTGEGVESGVVFQDCDVTDYPEGYPIAVVVAGRVRADRVSDEAVAAKDELAKHGLYLV